MYKFISGSTFELKNGRTLEFSHLEYDTEHEECCLIFKSYYQGDTPKLVSYASLDTLYKTLADTK